MLRTVTWLVVASHECNRRIELLESSLQTRPHIGKALTLRYNMQSTSQVP